MYIVQFSVSYSAKVRVHKGLWSQYYPGQVVVHSFGQCRHRFQLAFYNL